LEVSGESYWIKLSFGLRLIWRTSLAIISAITMNIDVIPVEMAILQSSPAAITSLIWAATSGKSIAGVNFSYQWRLELPIARDRSHQ
jgi:hypothetical protein